MTKLYVFFAQLNIESYPFCSKTNNKMGTLKSSLEIISKMSKDKDI